MSDLRVLVIDDDLLMLTHVEFILEQVGVTCVTAIDNGHVALDKIANNEIFDLIILDLNMPEIDGIEVMRKLAALEYNGAITLFSGEDFRMLKTAESLAEAHNLNFIGSLSKPVSIAAMKALLDNYHPHTKTAKKPPLETVCATELEEAISQNKIEPYFQPKVSASNQRIESAEVLARWHHPEKGYLPPISFIPIAEEHNLIDSLTHSIIAQSFKHLGRWIKQGYHFSIAINLSADSLTRVDLPEVFANFAKENGVPCNQIIFEITEGRLMKNLTTSLEILTRLRLKGFGLSIDDFGTGYSSMAQLTQIPFTELKIDQAFVHGAHQNASAKAVLESSAELARKLDMKIVAEGVEDQDDWDSVVTVGVDLVQGYFIAKPMSANDFEEWLKTH